jgi:hypothetical protein
MGTAYIKVGRKKISTIAKYLAYHNETGIHASVPLFLVAIATDHKVVHLRVLALSEGHVILEPSATSNIEILDGSVLSFVDRDGGQLSSIFTYQQETALTDGVCIEILDQDPDDAQDFWTIQKLDCGGDCDEEDCECSITEDTRTEEQTYAWLYSQLRALLKTAK